MSGISLWQAHARNAHNIGCWRLKQGSEGKVATYAKMRTWSHSRFRVRELSDCCPQDVTLTVCLVSIQAAI